MKRNIFKKRRKLKVSMIRESLRRKNEVKKAKNKKSYCSEKFLGEVGKCRQPSVNRD
jgi:hypothetical protein